MLWSQVQNRLYMRTILRPDPILTNIFLHPEAKITLALQAQEQGEYPYLWG